MISYSRNVFQPAINSHDQLQFRVETWHQTDVSWKILIKKITDHLIIAIFYDGESILDK